MATHETRKDGELPKLETKAQWIEHAMNQQKIAERLRAETFQRNAEANKIISENALLKNQLAFYKRRRDSLIGFCEHIRGSDVALTETTTTTEREFSLSAESESKVVTGVKTHFDLWIDEMGKEYADPE